MAGLLGDSMDDPGIQGLLSLGFGLMNSRGNFGQALGQAGPQALDQYNQASQMLQRRKLLDQETQSRAQQMEMAQQQLAEFRRNAQRQQEIDAIAPKFMRSPQQMAMQSNGGPTNAAAAAVPTAPQGFDFSGYAQALAGMDPKGSIAIQTAMRKELPKLSKLEQMRDGQGRMVNVAVFEDGSSKVLPYGVKPEIALQSLGNKLIAIDKNEAPNGASWNMGASPDALVQASTSMRGQDLTNARAGEANQINKEAARVQIVNDPNAGPLLIDKGTGLARPARTFDGAAVPSENKVKETKNAREALSLIGTAEKIIPGSTGSALGDIIDKAASLVSASTQGAQGTAQLKAIEGALMMKMPRMEGPQSNIDVANYRQAAGQLGDPWVPMATKIKALETVKEIQQRYAGQGSGVPADISDIMNKYRK